ncbi:hypothetical protein [Streptomyces sp. NPDC056264]
MRDHAAAHRHAEACRCGLAEQTPAAGAQDVSLTRRDDVALMDRHVDPEH